MSYSTASELECHGAIPIDQALEKIYLVKRHYISIPKCLLGKRVKLVIVK